jgi:hypothetical protein
MLWGVPAAADPSNLDLGALIVHHVPEMAFSESPPEGFCAHYLDHYAIMHYTQQVSRIDVADYMRATWFVLAAWEEPKEWCAAARGFGAHDPAFFTAGSHGGCFADQGTSLHSAGWPGPNEGVVVQTTTKAWTGNYLPVYYFSGYAYGYGGAEVIPLADPPGGIAGLPNCALPPMSWVANGSRVNPAATPIRATRSWCGPTAWATTRRSRRPSSRPGRVRGSS